MEVKAGMSGNHNNSPNEESFQLLFQQLYPLVVRNIRVIVKKQSIAEDIAQKAIVKLYRTDRNVIYNGPARLTKVAVTTAYNHIRTEKRRLARNDKQEAFGKNAASSVEEKYREHEDISSHIGIEKGSVGMQLAR